MNLLDVLIDAYSVVILIAVVLSWLRQGSGNPFARFVYSLTEPVILTYSPDASRDRGTRLVADGLAAGAAGDPSRHLGREPDSTFERTTLIPARGHVVVSQRARSAGRAGRQDGEREPEANIGRPCVIRA